MGFIPVGVPIKVVYRLGKTKVVRFPSNWKEIIPTWIEIKLLWKDF